MFKFPNITQTVISKSSHSPQLLREEKKHNHSSKLRCNAELHQYQPVPASGWLWGQGIQEIVYHHMHYYLFPGDIYKAWLDFKGHCSIGVLLIHVYPMRLSVTESPSFVCAAVGQVASFCLKHTEKSPHIP